jgi:hypothetical protein
VPQNRHICDAKAINIDTGIRANQSNWPNSVADAINGSDDNAVSFGYSLN